MSAAEKGIMHEHADGRRHRHFMAGCTIGKQVIADNDGSEEHTHGVLSLTGEGLNPDVSGPVVWRETDDVGTDTISTTLGLQNAGEAHRMFGWTDDPSEMDES